MRALRASRGLGRLGTVALTLTLTLVALLALGAWYAYRAFEDIPTFDEGIAAQDSPEDAPAADTPPAPPLELPEVLQEARTYLVFSTGSTGLSDQEASELGVGTTKERGADLLTDTLMLVVLNPTTQSASVLSIPRDTWIRGESSKINAIYPEDGPQALADTVTELTGLPVHHMISVDFGGFARLTDAVGGVPVYTEYPLRDDQSGLILPAPGCHVLDGKMALSFVRSRHTEYQDTDGVWRDAASASDFGRIQRQHAFLRSAVRELAGPRTLARIPELVDVAQGHLLVDTRLKTSDIVSLARAFSSSDPEAITMYTLPSDVGRAGQASVVYVNQAAAAPILSALQVELQGGGVTPALAASAPEPETVSPKGPTPSPSIPATGAPEPVPAPVPALEGTTPVAPSCS